MAKHATLLGHHGHGHPRKQVLNYFFAHGPNLHLGSPHRWLLRFSDPYGLCAFLSKNDSCYTNRADEK